MKILNNHYKFNDILNNIKNSLEEKGINVEAKYSSDDHSSYDGDTIFVGFGKNDNSKWLSLNIIEGDSDLFIHTNLQPKEDTFLIDESNNFEGFSKHTDNYLFRVGNINLSTKFLSKIITDVILGNLS